jgi:pimeloyl-ACP methyl ester carboxylesterase
VSTFLPGRRVVDWPADLAELADALGLARFAVAGFSGAGPYLAACAAALPARITTAGFVGCVGPLDLPGAADGLSWSRRAVFAAARRMPWRLAAALAAAAPRPEPERLLRAMTADAPDCDRAVLARPEVWSRLVAMTAEAIRPGLRGFALELALAAAPWGVRLSEVACPTYLWQGCQDRAAPEGMGRALAAALPGCRAHFLADAGHFLGIDRWGEILTALLASTSRGPAKL